MSKRQNGYVFHLNDQNILYEPTGDVSGLKNYSGPPITSVIVPLLSQTPKKSWDDDLSNREYKKMLGAIIEATPQIKSFYVRKGHFNSKND